MVHSEYTPVTARIQDKEVRARQRKRTGIGRTLTLMALIFALKISDLDSDVLLRRNSSEEVKDGTVKLFGSL